MKKITYFAVLMSVLAFGFTVSRAADEKKADKKTETKTDAKPAAGKKTAAELEKEKALANPYPNDLGPDKLDAAAIKALTPGAKKGYDLLVVRCAKCHSPARPLNSRFAEPDGKDDAAKTAAVAALKKSHPEMFGDKALGIFQVEDAVWKRYVKRMAAKPGCEIAGPEAKSIWEFLVFDSKRKLENPATWQAHREDLLKKFKEKFPKRYDQLKEEKDL